MKIRADILRMYKDIHSWVGITAGLALFVAFYAGAITMFESPLQNWATRPVPVSSVALEKTPELLAKIFAAQPQAMKSYSVIVHPTPEQPARVMWAALSGQERVSRHKVYAGMDADGNLEIVHQDPPEIANFINVLHQRVGLPFPRAISRPIMGIIALLYGLALISGTLILLPSLAKDLFALRISHNVKRLWLDVHNVLGFFSLPFHIVMATSSVVFAFHEPIFAVEHWMLGKPSAIHTSQVRHGGTQQSHTVLLTPEAILQSLKVQVPEFEPDTLNYAQGRGGKLALRVAGHDPRYALRGPDSGFAGVDPYTGKIVSTDYLPGHQTPAFAVTTWFFSLHFGSFGGNPVRWLYFVLGLAGAFLFYTGNLLWVESRRRRERKTGLLHDTRATTILASLTIGCTLGCVAGISASFAANSFLPGGGSYAAIESVYYAVFLFMIFLAFVVGVQSHKQLLLAIAGVFTIAVPVVDILARPAVFLRSGALSLDGTAFFLGASLILTAMKIHLRAQKRRCVQSDLSASPR
ncbi:PepSY-associated TM helix domain-containing protein [Gluconobacter wancherniae]|uniref:PepSY-associated TM helix domain-containing protein n=1 Tax=Gluconobacter wancherniae TaxID=1307955 RepID=UPI0030B45F89